ncbi:MAG: response regulator [Chloroflexi bacterium]|nr:MAG: response regulator [Chloroflexota bacterium]TMD63206.1 MAG: response regulator [Chloroflexota bacterium]
MNESSAAEPTSARRNGKHGLTVLLVGDDRDVAQRLAFWLRLDGHHVLLAHEGETAIDLAASSGADLIFLDLELPKSDGVTVLQTLRARDETRPTPVVILSNSTEPGLIAACLALGIQGHLVKSQLTPGELAVRLNRWTA